MTEAQAQNFVYTCGRWWLGVRNLSHYDVIRRTKTNCLVILTQLAGLDFAALLGPRYNVQIYVYGFSLLIFAVVTGLLLRLRQASLVLWKQYRFVR
ncbi:MAG: hypothetical protein JWQ04_1383 [Pedosphaera sp.]|nr:hypothetical protein [Pedosphaera sp.]